MSAGHSVEVVGLHGAGLCAGGLRGARNEDVALDGCGEDAEGRVVDVLADEVYAAARATLYAYH